MSTPTIQFENVPTDGEWYLAAQFTVTGHFGNRDELSIRHDLEDRVNRAFDAAEEANGEIIGECDGGQFGAGKGNPSTCSNIRHEHTPR